MRRVMPQTPDAREALEWLEERLENGWIVTVEQPGVGLPVEWTPQRWAYLVDDLHVPCFRTRDGELLMLITTVDWHRGPEYVVVDTRERIIYAKRSRDDAESR